MHDDSAFIRGLDTVTRSACDQEEHLEPRVPGLTLLGHPDPRRIGERVALVALASGDTVTLSRLEPLFSTPGTALRRPLADPHVSRRPVGLSPASDGGIRLAVAGGRPRIVAGGQPVSTSLTLPAKAVEDGVVLTLADRIVLLLHSVDPTPPRDLARFELVGESASMMALRQQITRVADLSVPALLGGETGTGKELVANAIHRASPRAAAPFVAVNMGALAPNLAAAELFGAAKGAFTGADRTRDGFFVQADGGTLFLDEVGEMAAEVQAMLLRTLETGVVQPLGAARPRRVDVRILAATDAQLEAEIAAGRFRAPLLHRLSGYEIWLPPLRARRDDLGRLLVHFLRQELAAIAEDWRLDGPTTPPWLPAALVERLAAYTWPGNVRQLRNVATQLVIGNRGAAQLRLTAEIQGALGRTWTRAADDRTEPGDEEPDLRPPGPCPPDEPPRPVLKTLLRTGFVDKEADGVDSRQAFQRVLQHERRARALLAEYDGHEIEKRDGFLLLFDRPADAVGFALEYLETAADAREELPAARLGIHVGEVMVRHNAPAEVARGARSREVEGAVITTVTRMRDLAREQQILISRTGADLTKATLSGDHPLANDTVRWLEHGPYQLGDDVVDVCEVGVADTAPFIAPVGVRLDCRPAGDGDRADDPGDDGTPSTTRPRYRSPAAVGEDEILAALRAHAFRVQPTAKALGISRTSLYALIKRIPSLRTARDLTPVEITASLERHGADLDAMAADLEVSRKGLRRRMTQLGMG